MSSLAVEVRNLRKHFLLKASAMRQMCAVFTTNEKICALNGINLNIKFGEILGIAGPNGAGKTTLLRIMADLLKPTDGTVLILGEESGNCSHTRRMVGYVPSDERSFFWRLTGRENLEFFGRLYGLSAKQARHRASELLKQFVFEQDADRLFRDYSAGMRKKIAIIRAISHKPPVLLLDEVTNSLDVESCKMVKAMVRNYVSNGGKRAVIWCTHRLEEIAEICDRVIVIKNGEIRFKGQANELDKNNIG